MVTFKGQCSPGLYIQNVPKTGKTIIPILSKFSRYINQWLRSAEKTVHRVLTDFFVIDELLSVTASRNCSTVWNVFNYLMIIMRN